MNASGLILLIPDKPDEERDVLANVWKLQGGEVLRLRRFWDPPHLDPSRVRIYGGTSFVLVLQQVLKLHLCTPEEHLILSLSSTVLKRRIELHHLGDADRFLYPLFVKPVAPKLFAAHVYADLAELRRECHGLSGDTPVFTSEAVSFVAEARAFVLDGEVLDCAFYEGTADLQEATKAAASFAHHPAFPRTFVMDVGFIQERGWVVIELNAAWGAGFNGCRAERIWPSIAAASGPPKERG